MRSNTVLKLGVQNWVSHKVASSLLEILLKEYMGFGLKAYDLTAANDEAWGEHISNGDFDIDVESWKAQPDSHQYKEYVTRMEKVKDAGTVGYYARKGFFTTPTALQSYPLASYSIFFKNATAVKAAKYTMFGEDNLKAGADSMWPLCNSDTDGFSWCGSSGSLEGYWAPAVCQASPSSCAVAFMRFPTGEKGRFEQLTANHGLYLIHGWAGNELPTKVKSLQASGKDAVFYWWMPDAFPLAVKAERISFPDWQNGCDSSDIKDPSGSIMCDVREQPLNKLLSSRLRDPTVAPEAHYLLSKFTILEHNLNEIMTRTKEAGGPLEPFDAACEWLKVNNDMVTKWVPKCLTNPGDPTKTGHTVFDGFTLRCKTVMAFTGILNKTCVGPISPKAPSKKERAQHVIRIVARYWMSQQISGMVASILLKDFLGYAVKSVQLYSEPTTEYIQQMTGDLYDVELESWYANPTTQMYHDNFIKEQKLVDIGTIGYDGRSGLFVSSSTAQRNAFTTYYKFYQDTHSIKSMKFPMHAGCLKAI